MIPNLAIFDVMTFFSSVEFGVTRSYQLFLCANTLDTLEDHVHRWNVGNLQKEQTQRQTWNVYFFAFLAVFFPAFFALPFLATLPFLGPLALAGEALGFAALGFFAAAAFAIFQ